MYVRAVFYPIIPSVRRIPNFINLKPGDCDYGIGNYHMNYWTDQTDITVLIGRSFQEILTDQLRKGTDKYQFTLLIPVLINPRD